MKPPFKKSPKGKSAKKNRKSKATLSPGSESTGSPKGFAMGGGKKKGLEDY